jgi:aspartyl-tRNA(Asn)/glutamyl-tRNA(Gln) amidotransferase subunit B
MDGLSLTPGALAETISLIDEGIISGKIAKDVLPRLLEGEGNSGVRAFVEAQGLVQISGEAGGGGGGVAAGEKRRVFVFILYSTRTQQPQ